MSNWKVTVTSAPGLCWRNVLAFRASVEDVAGRAADGTGFEARFTVATEGDAAALAGQFTAAGFVADVAAPLY